MAWHRNGKKHVRAVPPTAPTSGTVTGRISAGRPDRQTVSRGFSNNSAIQALNASAMGIPVGIFEAAITGLEGIEDVERVYEENAVLIGSLLDEMNSPSSIEGRHRRSAERAEARRRRREQRVSTTSVTLSERHVALSMNPETNELIVTVRYDGQEVTQRIECPPGQNRG